MTVSDVNSFFSDVSLLDSALTLLKNEEGLPASDESSLAGELTLPLGADSLLTSELTSLISADSSLAGELSLL